MQEKLEKNNGEFFPVMNTIKWRVFIRTDKESLIWGKDYDDYKVCPALHMNLHITECFSRDYINSGYLSTFEFDENSGLEATISYLNCPTVHFILLPAVICDDIYLTGGTRGLEKLGETTYPCKLEGSVWQISARNQFIPQIFNTQNVSIALGQTEICYKSETLLGGNWCDYALCFSLPKKNAQDIASQRYTDETVLCEVLAKNSVPYFVAPKDLEQYSVLLQRGLIAKNLQEWWKIETAEMKQLFCFLYAVIHGQSYREPLFERDLTMLVTLFEFKHVMSNSIPKHPLLVQHLNLLKNLITHIQTQLMPFDVATYVHVLEFFSNQLKAIVSFHSNPFGHIHRQGIESELQRLNLFYGVLVLEGDFWREVTRCQAFNFQPLELAKVKKEGLDIIRACWAEPSVISRKQLLLVRSRMTQVTQVTQVIKKQLDIFLNRNYVLNIGSELLEYKKIKGNKASYIYNLCEWYQAWTISLSEEIQTVSPSDLQQQALFCEKLKNSLILLSDLYEKYQELPQSTHMKGKSLKHFEEQVKTTITEIRSAFEQRATRDVGRYLHERTYLLTALLGSMMGAHGFHSQSIREHIRKLDGVRKIVLVEPKQEMVLT